MNLRANALRALWIIVAAVSLPAANAQPSSCLVGVIGDSNHGVTGATYPGSQIMTLIDPAECSGCVSGSGVNAYAVRLRMLFTLDCTVNVRIAVFGVHPGQCPSPDTSVVLVEPFVTTITDVAAAEGSWPKDYDVEFPSPGCISGKGFASVQFLGSSCDEQAIVVWGGGACTPCRQYQYALGVTSDLRDVCDFSEGPAYNQLFQGIVNDCCALVPTRGTTWGRLKTHYR